MSHKGRSQKRLNSQMWAFKHALKHLHRMIDEEIKEMSKEEGLKPKEICENEIGTLYKF